MRIRQVWVLAVAWLAAGVAHAQPPGVTVSEGRWRTAGGDLLVRDVDPYCPLGQACVDQWAPFGATEDAISGGLWTIVTDRQGARQWAYRGWALYKRTSASPLTGPEPSDFYAWALGEDGTPVIDGAARSAELVTAITVPELPEYPAASLRAAEQGVVVARLCINADGRVAYPVLARSSGFARLDEATLKWLPHVRYAPVLSDGKPAAVCNLLQEVAWSLPGYTPSPKSPG